MLLKTNPEKAMSYKTPEKLVIAKQFLDLVAEGMDRWEAAKKLGLANPNRDVFPLLQREESKRYIKEAIQTKLATEATPLAYQILLSVLRDTTLNGERITVKTKVDVAKTILAYSVQMVPSKAGDAVEEVAPENMTPAQLHAFMAQAEAELARRATPINAPQDADSWL